MWILSGLLLGVVLLAFAVTRTFFRRGADTPSAITKRLPSLLTALERRVEKAERRADEAERRADEAELRAAAARQKLSKVFGPLAGWSAIVGNLSRVANRAEEAALRGQLVRSALELQPRKKLPLHLRKSLQRMGSSSADGPRDSEGLLDRLCDEQAYWSGVRKSVVGLSEASVPQTFGKPSKVSTPRCARGVQRVSDPSKPRRSITIAPHSRTAPDRPVSQRTTSAPGRRVQSLRCTRNLTWAFGEFGCKFGASEVLQMSCTQSLETEIVAPVVGKSTGTQHESSGARHPAFFALSPTAMTAVDDVCNMTALRCDFEARHMSDPSKPRRSITMVPNSQNAPDRPVSRRPTSLPRSTPSRGVPSSSVPCKLELFEELGFGCKLRASEVAQSSGCMQSLDRENVAPSCRKSSRTEHESRLARLPAFFALSPVASTGLDELCNVTTSRYDIGAQRISDLPKLRRSMTIAPHSQNAPDRPVTRRSASLSLSAQRMDAQSSSSTRTLSWALGEFGRKNGTSEVLQASLRVEPLDSENVAPAVGKSPRIEHRSGVARLPELFALSPISRTGLFQDSSENSDANSIWAEDNLGAPPLSDNLILPQKRTLRASMVRRVLGDQTNTMFEDVIVAECA